MNQSITDMEKVFAPAVLIQGRQYQQNGHIMNLRISDGLLHARVRGSQRQIYDVYLNLKDWPFSPARCTCSVGRNCKHAAAAMMECQLQKDKYPGSANTSGKGEGVFSQWLQTIALPPAIPASRGPRQGALLYILQTTGQSPTWTLRIRLAVARKLKNGRLGKIKWLSDINEPYTDFADLTDDAILTELLYLQPEAIPQQSLKIKHHKYLQHILDSGRLLDSEQRPIQQGRARDLVLRWELQQDGSQGMRIRDASDRPLELIMLDQLWYLDADDNEMGPLHSPYSTEGLAQLSHLSPISLSELERVSAHLQQDYPQLPLPHQFSERQAVMGQPSLGVHFYAHNWQVDQAVVKGIVPPEEWLIDFSGFAALYYCVLCVQYDGITVAAKADEDSLYYLEGQTLVEVQRDRLAEERLLRQCKALLSPDSTALTRLPFQGGYWLAQYNSLQDGQNIMQALVPSLRAQGFKVFLHHSLYDEIIHSDDFEWYSDSRAEGEQFFSWQLGIIINGKAINIVPLVAELIASHDAKALDAQDDQHLVLLKLPQGKWLEIPIGRIKPLIRLILQYGVKKTLKEENIQLSRYQILLMQETELATLATNARWQGQESLRLQLQRLQNKSIPDVEPPAGLQTTLRDYQLQGLHWLQFLRQTQFSGILADDMGLGKTVQTLAHLLLEKEQGRLHQPSLIIAPTSLVGNWFNEAQRFTPGLNVLIFHGQDRHQDDFRQYDIIISTYGLIQRDKARFCECHFYYLILDEAQFIKNNKTKTTQVIQQLKARHRLCLSGTPLENHLGELWSLFHFLMPGLLGDERQFRKYFRNPIEKEGNKERQRLLSGRVQTFILRRNKKEVTKELPPKTEMTRMVELKGNQRDLYEGIRMMMEKKVREAIARQGLGKSHIVLLDALLKLRQVCCDPRLLSIPAAQMAHGQSAKLELLLELLDGLLDEGRKVLVFSQFTSMLMLIEQAIIQRGYGYLKLTGQTRHRQQLVDRFQAGEAPIFLISLKAGGTGLNLTQADTVIHYDPWWNPAVEDQATDRTHRIGQDNPVFVYRLIARGTVEEVILQMQDRKRQLIDGVFAPQEQGGFKLSAHDIEQFFVSLD
ncbi:MAG: DEAD/DEAH box helicase [Legionellaceae bacterium]|nr:DEAD/DEAH box helicase [Legionellaceae bacterium]